jgi:hypothetical protein
MNRAKPRYSTKATKGSKTWQQPILNTAETLGTPLMPWQKRGARLLAEYSDVMCSCHDPAIPLPRYKTVVITVPRQQGKTAVSRAAVVTVAEREFDQELYGTAQSRQYAARHVVRLGEALKRADPTITVNKGVGNEKVVWDNGSTYMPISPSEGGGHGDSIDFMLVDEGWALEIATLGGVRPAMIARPHSQMLVISTMGTLESTVWNGMVEGGREAAENDERSGVAYIEFSAPTDEAVFEDTCTDDSKIGTKACVWGQWMPALGYTVTHADIRAAIKDMLTDPAQGRSEVVRAFGNRTVAQLVSLFPSDQVESAWRVIEPPSKFVLAVDVNEEPAGASVATGHLDSEGRMAGRVIEWRYGTPRWVAEFCRKVIRERDVEALIADLGGPTRAIRGELQALCDEELTSLVDRVPRDLAADTQRFYDGLREGTVVLEKNTPLSEAIAGAVRKDFSDSGLWVVSRGRMSVDASPILAAIMAMGVAAELSVKPKSEFFVY